MDVDQRKELLDASLERAGEELGDIAPIVAQRFCRRFPDAEGTLDTLWPGARDQLEGQMVETALYSFMHWFDSPGEIEVLFWSTVPHHADTLGVPKQWFAGFLETTAEVIVETIPDSRRDERSVWAGLVRDLLDVIAQSQD